MKLTKNGLKEEEEKLQLFTQYLPTLQLKKVFLQNETSLACRELQLADQTHKDAFLKCESFKSLKLEHLPQVIEVRRGSEKSRGVNLPFLDQIFFKPCEYRLVNTPVFTEAAFYYLTEKIIAFEKLAVAEEKKKILEEELQKVSIRVNLFEKVLIPKTLENIKKIKVFLQDQELAAISRAKVAKTKALKRYYAS